jgi:hypothetical protein
MEKVPLIVDVVMGADRPHVSGRWCAQGEVGKPT